MIIKGKSRTGPRQLGKYLSEQGTNEKIKVVEIHGTAAQNPRDAIFEMDAYALGTKCEKPLYHGFINPEPPYFLTPEQLNEAVDALEEKLGLDGHARVVLVHEKFDRQGRYRQHIHIVWSRIDLDRMVAVSDSFNYRKHEEVSRDLERRFGHPRVQGAHAERDNSDRPDRTPSEAEKRQEERTGISAKELKAEVTETFRASDGPEAFKAALEEQGYILAQGDRRDFVIVDRAGGIHSLARRIEAIKAAELREFMAPLDRESLPTVEQAREAAQDRAAGLTSGYDQKKWDDALAASAVEKERERRRDETTPKQDETLQISAQEGANRKQENPSREGKRKGSRGQGDDSILSVGLNVLSETVHETFYILDETRKELNFIADELARPTNQPLDAKSSESSASDAQSAEERVKRLLGDDGEREAGNSDDWEPDKQREAPGGGRTRSR